MPSVFSRLSPFFTPQVLARLEPLLPASRVELDWSQSLAARWQRDGRSGHLQPLTVSLDLNLSDLIGLDQLNIGVRVIDPDRGGTDHPATRLP